MATMIVLSGLPGTGKSTISRAFSLECNAVWVRIDSIEQAIRESVLKPDSVGDAGYRVGFRIAEDNLRLGHDVIADSVNPWMETRDGWRDVGLRAGVNIVEVELQCSDVSEHRHRIESRKPDVANLASLTWQEVIKRDYRDWDRPPFIIDTAGQSVGYCVNKLLEAVRAA